MLVLLHQSIFSNKPSSWINWPFCVAIQWAGCLYLGMANLSHLVSSRLLAFLLQTTKISNHPLALVELQNGMYHETIHIPLYQLYQQDISSIAGGCICTIPHLQWKLNSSIDCWTSTEPASGSCKPLAPDSECAHLNSWKHQKTKYHIKACRPIASEEDTHIVKHILMTPQNQTSACKVLNYQLLSQWRYIAG
jgi:hypothetical protein